MLSALARFIMRGRLQASVIALLGIPVITHAAVALVTLRKGSREGILMLAIALVPSILAGLMGKPSQSYFWFTLLGMLAVLIPAACLRATVSWSFALQMLVVYTLLVVVIAARPIPSLIDSFADETAMFIAMLTGDSIESDLPKPSTTAISGLLGFGFLFYGLTGVILARWWQSLLYNPGGFGVEFRKLRLAPLASTLLLAMVCLCLTQGTDYVVWASLFAAPLVLVSVAVVHSLVKAKNISKHWLLAFYVLIIVFTPALLILAVLGCLDSWLNIRSRFKVSD